MKAIEGLTKASCKEIENEIKEMNFTELMEARRELAIVNSMLFDELGRKEAGGG